MTLFAIMSLLVGMFVTAIANPLAAFASASNWLIAQAQNCK